MGLHWLRRDLRVADNPALIQNLRVTQGRTLAVFFFDGKFLARPDFSHARFAFFLESLKALRSELQKRGGDLLVLEGGPRAGFEKLLDLLKSRGLGLPACVSWNRDYEPFARARDEQLARFLGTELKIPLLIERDHLLLEPEELLKDDGTFYQVFTPFARRWFARLPEIRERLQSIEAPPIKVCWADVLGPEAHALDQLERYASENARSVLVPIPPAGEVAAARALSDFGGRIDRYADTRDVLALRGGSGLSIYLKNGSLTLAQIISRLSLQDQKLESKSGRAVFLKELCWREFYYHVLFHRPDVERQSFLEKYREIRWQNDEAHFEAWKSGRTGYPIVDAAMRELATTGLMHNRARMIVASFLTKHLLIDWRWGERWFMQNLLDGDLAPNNGGWQWAASTGCDPQPYFRVFNPTLQSEKFDPNGDYIRRYVPELSHLGSKQIHAPAPMERGDYPAPIVDHATARTRAIERYKSVGDPA